MMATAPETQPVNPAEIVLKALKAEVVREMARPPAKERKWLYASEWHPCKRNLFLKLTRPDALPEHEPETLARFKRGKERETDVVIWLTRAGMRSEPLFTIEGAQERVEIKDRGGETVIVGRKEFDLVIRSEHYPCEIKAWPEMHKRINRVEDLELSPWTRGAEMQLLAYLYGTNQAEGFLILDTPSLPKFIRVSLEDGLEKMERFLQDAEEVTGLAAIDPADGAPDFINDPAECRRCPFFGRACSPPLDFGAGAEIITDAQIIQEVERETELHDSHIEYSRLHKTNAARFREVPEFAIVGDCLVTVKRGKKTTYTIPKEIKEQYVQVDPEGRVTVSVEKLPEPK